VKNRRVLVVDDNESVQVEFRKILGLTTSDAKVLANAEPRQATTCRYCGDEGRKPAEMCFWLSLGLLDLTFRHYIIRVNFL
jgi:hypothetical protein